MPPNNLPPVRIGVIGLGRFGRLHALTLAGLAEADVGGGGPVFGHARVGAGVRLVGLRAGGLGSVSVLRTDVADPHGTRADKPTWGPGMGLLGTKLGNRRELRHS